MNEHKNWYLQLVGDATERSVALKAGVTTSTLNRQLKAGTLSAENVILIARAYGANPVAALTTTGYITLGEATKNLGDIARLLPDRQLIAELARRIGVTVEELIDAEVAPVEDVPREFVTPVDELIEERAKKGNNGNTGESIKDTKPHAVSSFDPDHDAPFYDPETMAAYPRHEIIPPDDQFDI